MITNPRFPGSAARMADARLFTDYRANCTLIPQNTDKLWSEHQRHVHLQSNGAYMIAADRNAAVTRASSARCVDTMVPELSKRVYRWDGPVTQTQGISHPAGVGTGRLYLPGRTDLVGADPDIVAAATFPVIPGTFEARKSLYGQVTVAVPTAGPAQHNRYSAPYGQ
jgi:hypothetical protein